MSIDTQKTMLKEYAKDTSRKIKGRRTSYYL